MFLQKNQPKIIESNQTPNPITASVSADTLYVFGSFQFICLKKANAKNAQTAISRIFITGLSKISITQL